MMRSMFSGVSGLRTHQTKMDVIGNNIANVNTVGFKAGTVTFKEIFTQTLQGASSDNADTGRGGINPRQIGLGVAVGSIDNLMTQGAAQTTDNPLDLMISGNAFFIVGDSSSGFYFTRAGAFRLDVAGNLVNADGLKVNGWSAKVDDATGKQVISKGKVSEITIKSPENLYIKPEATTRAAFEGNINIEEGQSADGILKSLDFYDSLGNNYRIEYKMTYDATNQEWTLTPQSPMIRNDNENDTVPLPAGKVPTVTVTFNESGTLDTANPAFQIQGFTGAELGLIAETQTIDVDLSGFTQFLGDAKTTVKGFSTNGCQSGELIGFSIGSDGVITGTYSNGNSKMLGQIAVANFRNPAGLEKVGGNLFVTTPNSGAFDGIGDDPTYGGGSITGGCLEMSNVDLAKEFTEMITTQRGFQANSRVITTSDEMLQELVRLK